MIFATFVQFQIALYVKILQLALFVMKVLNIFWTFQQDYVSHAYW